MTWTARSLPNIQELTTMDPYLRQVATDVDAIRDAIAMATSALDDARRDDHARMQASLLGYLTEAHRVIGELDIAESLAREALTLPCEEPFGAVIANHIRLGEILRCQLRFDEAIEAHLRALSDIQDEATERYRGFALQHLGKVFLNMGNFDQAESILTMALEIRRKSPDAGPISSTEEALAYARARRGAVEPEGLR